MNPNFKDPRSTQWNLTIERELVSNWVLRLTYIGSNTSGLPVYPDLNEVRPSTTPYNPASVPYPNFGVIGWGTNLGFSNYQAFNPSIDRRFSNGLSLQANYTWAKELSDANGDAPAVFATPGAGGFTLINDWYNMRNIRGNAPGIPRQRFLLTALYDIPVGKGRRFLSKSNAFVNGVLGGWQLSTVTLVETGPFLTPTISAIDSQSNIGELYRGTTVRPDRIANGNISNPTPNMWWDINAFVPTPAGAGRVGNAGVGILEGPGTVAIAGGLSKNFAIAERARLRFEATFTNLPNHPNFAAPPTDISDPTTFGKVVTTQSAENSGNRVGQLSARIDF